MGRQACCIASATFFFIFGLGYFIESLATDGLQNAIHGLASNVYDALGVVSTLLALAGVVISWWWLLPAGIFLIFAYFLGAASGVLSAVSHAGYFDWSQLLAIWSMPGIAYPIAGILFLASWWFSKKRVSLNDTKNNPIQ